MTGKRDYVGAGYNIRELHQVAGPYTGAAGVLVLFAGGLWSPPLLYLGLLLVLIALALSPHVLLGGLVREPLAWIAAGLVLWVGIRGWIDFEVPGVRDVDPDPRAIWHHIRYSGLVPLVFGCWLCAWWHRRMEFMAVLCFGLIAYYASVWQEIAIRIPIGRVHRGSLPEMGLIAAMGTVLCGGFVVSIWYARKEFRWRAAIVLSVVAGSAFLTSAAVLIVSNVRSSWLSITIGLLLLAAVGLFWAWCKEKGRRRGLIVRTTLIIAAAVSLALWASSAFFWDRIVDARDMRTLAALFTGEFGAENEGSFAIRYRALRQGLEDISASPLWGVGPASVHGMLEALMGEGPGRGNYHNTYINLAVAMGLPWAILWILVHAAAIARAGHILWVIERDPVLAFTLLGACIVHFIDLTFQVRVWSVNGSAAYIILMSITFGAILRAYTTADFSNSQSITKHAGSGATQSRMAHP